jgi:hypothetical protein
MDAVPFKAITFLFFIFAQESHSAERVLNRREYVFSPEDVNRTSFRNVVLSKYDDEQSPQ